MQTVIVIIIIAAAAGFLIRRIIKYGAGGTCGCSCKDCGSKKETCQCDKIEKKDIVR